ncbi:MAG TPA: tetratricopeptide repeat protein [Bacteroidota bacterium]|jgi:hypothetical protein|nr:tetratricopeptide repeat protein [Bacteroidota bacterium]
MKHWYVISFIFISRLALAQEASLQFEQANQLYRSADYQGAAKMYDLVVKNGYESAALYYNLGNAHFKLKDIPSAILNYERARRLAPHDDDVQYNLRLANLRVVDKIEPVPQIFFIEWWSSIMSSLSSGGWAVLAIVSLWCTAVCGAITLLMRSPGAQKISLGICVASLLLCVLGFTGTIRQYRHEQNDQTAIVFSPSIPVKSSPDAQSTDLFVLHEGVKVDLLDTVGEWKKIRLADGKMGWIPAEGIRVI